MAALPIASRWFERRIVSHGLTLLYEPHLHPLVRCNIWHLRGRDRDLLVDTGLGAASLRDEIADLVDKPLVAVATHIHYDHVGGLHEFDTRLVHASEAARMADYREFSAIATARLPAPFLEFLAGAGMPVVGDALIDAVPCEDFDIDGFRIRSASPTGELEDGHFVDLADRHFEVLHLPGHSVGSIGLWEQKTGTLFSGDAIYDGVLLDDLPDSDVASYVRTMRRLRELPVEVVHGGHEPSFGRARMVEIANAYLASRT